jgi:hypothetical protein
VGLQFAPALFKVTHYPGMSKGLRRSEIAAPPVEWRLFRFWGLLVLLILALAVLAAIYRRGGLR